MTLFMTCFIQYITRDFNNIFALIFALTLFTVHYNLLYYYIHINMISSCGTNYTKSL